MSKFTKVLMGLCLAVFAAQSIGCNATKGAGRDLERAAERTEDAID